MVFCTAPFVCFKSCFKCMNWLQVMEAKDQLEQELKELQVSGDVSVSSVTDDTHDELRRLQAENSALQKNLHGNNLLNVWSLLCTLSVSGYYVHLDLSINWRLLAKLPESQRDRDEEVAQLRHNVTELETRCRTLAAQRQTPLGENRCLSCDQACNNAYTVLFWWVWAEHTNVIVGCSDSRLVEGASDEESRGENTPAIEQSADATDGHDNHAVDGESRAISTVCSVDFERLKMHQSVLLQFLLFLS